MTEAEYNQYEECFQGNSWVRTANITDANGNAFDLTDCTLDFYLYQGSTEVIHKSIGSGISIVNLTGGSIYIRLAPADTSGLDLATYNWFLNVNTIDSDVFTTATGILAIKSAYGATTDSLLDLVQGIGPYVISDEAGSNFTTSEFNYLETKATSILNFEDPGFPQQIHDHALVLLILHFHEMRLGNSGMISESLNGYSYNRGKSNNTGWKTQYDELVLKGGEWFSQDVNELPAPLERVDESMPEFNLDQSRIKKYDQTDKDYESEPDERDIY